MPHDVGNLAPGVKFANPIGIMLGAISIGGCLGKPRARRQQAAEEQKRCARCDYHGGIDDAASRAVCRERARHGLKIGN
jgi:hypothetical protein